MTKMLADKDDLLLWVPDGGIDDITAPNEDELTAMGVIDFSCAVSRANFTLGASGDNPISDPALCSGSDSQEPGLTSYAAGMDFYRDTVTGSDKGFTTFTGKGIHGFWVHRVGVPITTAIAATQKVRVFGAISGSPQFPTPDIGAARKMHVDFYVQGEEVDERAVVAAGA
jgi:hypothetical protein